MSLHSYLFCCIASNKYHRCSLYTFHVPFYFRQVILRSGTTSLLSSLNRLPVNRELQQVYHACTLLSHILLVIAIYTVRQTWNGCQCSPKHDTVSGYCGIIVHIHIDRVCVLLVS